MAISTERSITNDKGLEALKLLMESLQEKYSLSPGEIVELAYGKKEGIPLSIFSVKGLGIQEAAVKYLKENCSKRYHEIARILNRNDRTIWSAYKSSLKKSEKKLEMKQGDVLLPLNLFSSRKRSMLESLVIYLKEELGYSFSMISRALARDYQTIYTTYRRGKVRYD